MLASDVALYKDIQVTAFIDYVLEKVYANGTRTCMRNTSNPVWPYSAYWGSRAIVPHNLESHYICPAAPTAPVVEAFAASNQVLHLIC